MSNASDIYIKIRALVPTLTGFTTKKEIPNPYSLEDNSVNLLRDSWGVKIGTSTPTEETDRLPDYVETTDYEVVLSRQVVKTDSDPDKIPTATQSMLNDFSTLENNFTPDVFGTTEGVSAININSTTGIENVTAGKFNHITASIIFEITHWR